MKIVKWYLPSGAGGMAALHKANRVKTALREWAVKHSPGYDPQKSLNYLSENGLKYCYLIMSDEDAIIFALSWQQSGQQIHYESINDYIPRNNPV